MPSTLIVHSCWAVLLIPLESFFVLFCFFARIKMNVISTAKEQCTKQRSTMAYANMKWSISSFAFTRNVLMFCPRFLPSEHQRNDIHLWAEVVQEGRLDALAVAEVPRSVANGQAHHGGVDDLRQREVVADLKGVIREVLGLAAVERGGGLIRLGHLRTHMHTHAHTNTHTQKSQLFSFPGLAGYYHFSSHEKPSAGKNLPDDALAKDAVEGTVGREGDGHEVVVHSFKELFRKLHHCLSSLGNIRNTWTKTRDE